MRGKASGTALVICLCFIVLCTILVVAFLSNVSTSGVGERAGASENSASQLAESAVQLMQGTITYATEPGADTTAAWACQPGMIRVYGGNGTASSTPTAYYKLYSSSNMVVNSTQVPSFNFTNEVPQTWDTTPALYTDLNAPLSVGGSTVFPIVDPRAADLGVEGFSYSSGSVDGVVATGTGLGKYATDTTSRLPMPVQWIYVLRDGSMTAPTSGGSNSATFSGSSSPTASNPIVGRVAFWTDDECAKINVNTASEGTYWDTPVANSGSSTETFSYPQVTPLGDVGLAINQGAQHEYQRYPGHPATTCLSSVFGYSLTQSGASRASIVQSITNAIPRVSDYASGAQPSGSLNSTLGGTTNVSGTTGVLVTDMDRLYADLDEFQFAPSYSGSSSRAVQNLGTATLGQQDVEACRFFLTAHSKAPEINLFGLPRVAIWPLWSDPNAAKRTTYDNEILRCSTIASGTTSSGSTDPHHMAFFRGDPSSASNDWTGIARNQQVYGYLHSLMNQPVPGFGLKFSAQTKFGNLNPFGATDGDQILTEIFDYIRSTNLSDNSAGATPFTTGTGATCLGQVVPIKINSTQGFGRFSTISELAIVLVKMDDRKLLSMPDNSTNLATKINVNGGPSGVTNYDPSKQTLVEWTLIPRFHSAMAGYVPLFNNMRIRFKSVNLSIGGYAATTSWSAALPDLYRPGTTTATRDSSAVGGPLDPLCFAEPDTSGNGGQSAPGDSMYPTGLALVNGTSGAITLSGNVVATVYGPAGSASAPGTQIQQITFTLPAAPPLQVPIPTMWLSGTTWKGAFRTGPSCYSPGATGTLTYPAPLVNGAASKSKTRCSAGANGSFFDKSTDVARSLTATGSPQ